MSLVQSEGMQVLTKAALARKLAGRGPDPLSNDLTLIIEDAKPLGVFIPYDIWFQIQHFVSRIIER